MFKQADVNWMSSLSQWVNIAWQTILLVIIGISNWQLISPTPQRKGNKLQSPLFFHCGAFAQLMMMMMMMMVDWQWPGQVATPLTLLIIVRQQYELSQRIRFARIMRLNKHFSNCPIPMFYFFFLDNEEHSVRDKQKQQRNSNAIQSIVIILSEDSIIWQ